MYISTFAFFGTFPFLFFILSLALPEADGLGKSKSGESFDDIIKLMVRTLPTHVRGDDNMIRAHKGSLTQGWSQYLSVEYPNKNILIYHNQSSAFEGVNAIHRTIELTSESNDREHTYEIQIFDSGTFALAGEGGYHNWAFCGNWSQSRSSVNFYPLADLSGIFRSGLSPAKLGGGFLTHYVEDTSLSIRADEGNWSPPEYDPVSGQYISRWSGSLPTIPEGPEWDTTSTEIDESVISWVESDAVIPETASLLAPSLALAAGVFVVSVIILALWVAASVIFAEMISVWRHRNSRERAFTQSTVMQHASAVPNKNIIVFHNQDSSWSFSGWAHMHHELSLGGPFHNTQGYEIYAFDYGNFTLTGDGGYENWALAGNFQRDPGSLTVYFYPRPGSDCTPALKTRADSDKQLRLRQPIPPQVPTRENHEMKDGHYFVDCVKPDNTLSLGIAYYENIEPGGGNIGQLPDDFVEVYSNHAGVKAWQGEGHANFNAKGMSFQWNFIDQGWQDDLVTAGIASTAFEQFWVYKDAGELLFNTTANWACSSLYYAF